MHAMEDIVVIPSQDQTNHTSHPYGLKIGPLSTEYLVIQYHRDLLKILPSRLPDSSPKMEIWSITIW
jgi:hypothetical protein